MDSELTTLDAVEMEIRARVTIRDIIISLFSVLAFCMLSSCRKLSGYKSGCCSTLTN